MKTKTKQTKIDRSAAKWLPGAMALAATTASSQAATVQITLTAKSNFLAAARSCLIKVSRICRNLPLKFPQYISTWCIVGLTLASNDTHAAVIFGNLPGNDGTSTVLFAGRSKALAFTMNVGSDLGSMVLRLKDMDTSNVMNVRLMNDTGGTDPGTTALADFTTPAFQGLGIFDYIFNPTTPFTLQSGTKYWLQVDYVSGSTAEWMASTPSLTPTGLLATYDGQRFSTNGGGSWVASSIINTFALDSTVVSAVPEPGSNLALLALVAGGLTLRRRLKRAA